jgi:hypothetical protein
VAVLPRELAGVARLENSPRSSVVGAVMEEGRQWRSTAAALRPRRQGKGNTERWRK